ncbi:DUF6660 family protein [Flavobacterium soli]|uniref:DUF6660 family protein n=1 Tax=Flavobacterium soli TaxID=344881 RepID=UPI000479897B
MKFLNFILSIYLVALSCVPCVDMEVSSAAHKTIGMDSNHKDHSHDKENDLCSPFCSCNCCGSQIVTYFKAITIDPIVVSKRIKTQLTSYTSKFTSNFYGSIWQPPQIV